MTATPLQPAGVDLPLAPPTEPPTEPREEPCESCGTPVVLLDLLALACQAVGATPREDRNPPTFCEVHTRALPDGGMGVQMRAHDPELCRAVRAGQPVPVEWDSDVDEDLEADCDDL